MGASNTKRTPVFAVIMEAVSGITPFHIQAERITPAIGAAHVRVLCCSIRSHAHEYDIVMICILIEQLRSNKFDQHIPVDPALPEQVRKGASHIGACRGAGQRALVSPLFLRRRECLSAIPSQQRPHRLRKVIW